MVCETIHCGPDCDWIFNRVWVRPDLLTGDTRVEWELHPQFAAAGPYRFQLQVSAAPTDDDAEWTSVGSSVVDTFFAIDDRQRDHGKERWTHYRVLVTAEDQTYASPPTPYRGELGHQYWQYAKTVLRKQRFQFQRGGEACDGFLLKRRISGEACDCVDLQTQECRNSQHIDCYGTGWVGGYYRPVACVYAKLPAVAHRVQLDLDRGTVDDRAKVMAVMLNTPQLRSYDVWVRRDMDTRWRIHTIEPVVQIAGVALVVGVELRLIPFSDVVYRLPIEV